jgi:hypothetical protein
MQLFPFGGAHKDRSTLARAGQRRVERSIAIRTSLVCVFFDLYPLSVDNIHILVVVALVLVLVFRAMWVIYLKK